MRPTTPFVRYWSAATISSFGTAVTGVAVPVLTVQVLEAAPWEVGAVGAAQFLPYAVVGLLAGAYVDRWSRRRVLVWSSLGRAAALGAIPVLHLLHALQVWSLIVALLVFGGFSVFGFAATQSLLPQLVPATDLVRANARLDQSDAAAQTVGPALGGGLVGLLGAPLAIVVDAVSYLVDAALNTGLRVEEPPPPDRESRDLRREVREGLGWTYRHPSLAPLAMSTHVWFLASSASLTALAVIALRTLGLSPVGYSLLLATSGVAGLLGASLAPSMGRRLGAGHVILLARAGYPVAWLALALCLTSPIGTVALFVALALHGLAAGIENANEMGYWQGETPGPLLGRVNATRRAVNRTVAAAGALLGGTLLTVVGARTTLLVTATTFAAAVAILARSPLRADGATSRSP